MPDEKRIGQQTAVFERILTAYTGEEPLPRFLGKYFKANRQMGSKDRKTASRLIYSYFRLGTAAMQQPPRERLAMGEFLCHEESAVVQYYLPEYHPYISEGVTQKIKMLEEGTPFRLVDVFPFLPHLSQSIDQEAFLQSLFIQPDLFIRLRPGHEQAVLAYLNTAGVPVERLSSYTLALPNGTALDRLPHIRGKYEVQDRSSQQTVSYFEPGAGEQWWDACAGSGGKSLLLKDNYPAVNLLVSDMRGSILRNLDERFDAAGISDYRRKLIDLAGDPDVILGGEQFDGIILDAPCSGSGTWGRTPEMMTSFDGKRIPHFAALQKKITGNAVKYLKQGKPLVYITCSVFAEENEGVVSYLEKNCGLVPDRMEMLHGYRHRADTMFVARLIKS